MVRQARECLQDNMLCLELSGLPYSKIRADLTYGSPKQSPKWLMASSPCPGQPLERSASQVNSSPEDGASGSSEAVTPGMEDFEVRGSRFSKSAEERQKMLLQRRDELLLRARRYIVIRLRPH